MGVAELISRLPEKWRVLPVIVGAVLIHISLGTYHTFGNMLPYMSSYMRNRTDPSVTLEQMMWIPTMQGCFPFAMVVGGMLASILGPRGAALVGCFIMSSGVYVSSYSIQHSFFSFLITYGLMFGMGQGIAYVVAVSSVINWAPNKVGLVSGVVAAGFGVSSSFFAPIQTTLVNPWNHSPLHDGYFHDQDLLDRVPQVFRILGMIYAGMQAIGLIFICDPPNTPLVVEPVLEKEIPTVDPRSPSWEGELLSSLSSCMAVRRGSVSGRRTFSAVRYSALAREEQPLTAKVRHRSLSNGSSDDADRSSVLSEDRAEAADDSDSSNDIMSFKSMRPSEVIRSSTFYLLFASLFCCSFYANTFYNLYKTFAETFIEDDMFLAFAFSAGSLANAIARIAWGQLTDKTSFQTSLSLACCGASALLLTMPLTPLGGKPLFLMWLVLLFICMAATHALFITAVVRCFGPKHKATNYGLLVLSTTCSGVALSLMSQYLLRLLGYGWMFIITAIFPFLAFGLSAVVGITPQGFRITGV